MLARFWGTRGSLPVAPTADVIQKKIAHALVAAEVEVVAGLEAAWWFFGGVPQRVVPDYVARHVIRLLCPTRLCGRDDRDAPARSGSPARGAETGHITQPA